MMARSSKEDKLRVDVEHKLNMHCTNSKRARTGLGPTASRPTKNPAMYGQIVAQALHCGHIKKISVDKVSLPSATEKMQL